MKKKTALITGASRGIGRAVALRFAKEGYGLALVSRKQEEALLEVKQEAETYGVRCLTFLGDVGDYEFVERMCAIAMQEFGQIDCLINNAGISYIGLLSDMKLEDWDRIVKTNLTSVFAACRCLTPHMIRRQEGCILNISSVWGECGASCEVAYSATKGGVNAFTKALGKELAPSRIRVNAISCGAIDTSMNHFLDEEEQAVLLDEIPMGRMGRSEEVAELALQLAETGTYITGQIIRMDGGWI